MARAKNRCFRGKGEAERGIPGFHPTKMSEGDHDSLRLFFDQLNRLYPPNAKEEYDLTCRIKMHLTRCVETIVTLIRVTTEIARLHHKERSFTEVDGHQLFTEHLEPKEREKTLQKKVGQEALLFLEEYNPKGLVGEELASSITHRVQQADVCKYLEEFSPPNARKDFQEMVLRNLRLVVTIASRYGGVPMLDLIQEGTIGLMIAATRFDPARGLMFSTYSSWWIRSLIGQAVSKYGRIIRIPTTQESIIRRSSKAKRNLTSELGRPPTDQEIADATNIPVQKIRKKDSWLKWPQYFDVPLQDKSENDSQCSLWDIFCADTQETTHPITNLEIEQDVTRLRAFMRTILNPRERDILERRFGFKNDEPQTLREIGETEDLCRERVRQLQNSALKKLRTVFKEHNRAP